MFSLKIVFSTGILILIAICSLGFAPCYALERIDSQSTSKNTNGPNTNSDWSRLTSIDKKLLMKSLVLQEYVAKGQRAAMTKYKFRKWIDLGGQEAAASGLLAATIVGVDELGPNLNRPLKINIKRLERGLNAGIVTSIIGASASASQLGLDALHIIRNTKKGYGPIASKRRFFAGIKELDQLFEERTNLIASSPELKNSNLVKAETDILNARRALIAKEFLEVYCYETASNSAQSIYYGFDITRNTTTAIGLNLLKKGLKKPYLNEPGSIWLIIGSVATIAGPWASDGAGKLIGKYQRRSINKKLKYDHTVTMNDLLTARKNLRAVIASNQDQAASATAVNRTTMLDDSHNFFSDRLKNELDRRNKLRRSAYQQKFASAAIGGQFLAFGIMDLTAWQKYGQNGRIIKSNKLVYASNIVGLSASAIAVGATGLAAVGSELHEWKTRKTKDNPLDLLNAHIDRIEKVKAELINIPE